MHLKTFIAGAFTVGALASAHGPSGPQTTSGLVPRHGPDGDDKHSIFPRHGPDGDDKQSILPRHGPDGDGGKTTMVVPRGAHEPSILPRHGPDGDDKRSIVPREAHGPDGDGGKTTMIVLRDAHDPTKVVARAPAATPTTETMPSRTHPSYDPTKVSKFHSDMHKLHTKIRADPLYTSMTKALKTAIPESYREAMRSNPASVHMQYHTSPPDWYKKLPDNVRSFMEKNQKDAKSIWEKDMGPIPTGKNGKDDKHKDDKKAKSEAPAMSIVGATVCALVGAFGVAALLL